MNQITEKAETLTRYILNKKHTRPGDNSIRYNLFLPNTNGDTSVFRISGISEKEVWEIGVKQVAETQDKSLYGRGDILDSNVLANRLTIETIGNHPRHANITGWPKEKPEQRLIAMELARDAKLYLND